MPPIKNYIIKLQFPDGRWSVDEAKLAARPRTGTLVDLGPDGRWSVDASTYVPVRPSGKPPREVFLCVPAAA